MSLPDIHNHYVQAAQRALDSDRVEPLGANAVAPAFRAPYRYWERWLRLRTDGQKQTRILDYGCGRGTHSIYPATLGANVVGVDIVAQGLIVASARANASGVAERTKFVLTDCERLSLVDAKFDILFSSGMLFCLNPRQAFHEMARVLRPNGTAFMIETLGENRVAELARRIRAFFRPRAATSYPHRFRLSELRFARESFGRTETRYFALATALVAPLTRVRGAGRLIARVAELLDEILCRIPGIRTWSMKIVVILSEPLIGTRDVSPNG